MPATAPRSATVVAGRYRLLDQVGSGGMGSVWRAHDVRTGQDVALKVLGRHGSALLARFVREQAVRVRHPHVVAPHGWAAEDDLVVLAMELVTGGSVADLLREHGPLDPGTAALLVEQLLMGLGAVHGAGLVHRDVKPANLLLEATGDGPPHLRLGDFGVAAPVADRRFTTVPGAIGTDGYMAPEQARGAPPEPTQDLYAVGRVALELVTGLPPAGQGDIPSHPLRPLLERLLVSDPEQRIATADAALRLLRRLPVPPPDGPPVPDRLGPPPRRRRTTPTGPRDPVDWPGWLAVAALVAVVAGCLWVLLGWSS
ncbi:serine/threonine-protein kinase [Nocardioides ganghwensis]|uniref:non-specific serine/threonine protein kinase n=1 Tax=Nocardioides ganghwensis TaxID=252230 RepID=A0A4Q2SAW6_9ACTN|nr:serine/threonine-protein kinase [Nocardioides ganghwensis]MBD3947738.1 serine/threonine protein kinase [Nocardioides ganghwensis]RYB98287.1 serine/threonine protein kinase [Nocardioides ganghwensis]